MTALLGPNGAGKSSMVLAIGGVLPLKAGSVKLGDRELAGKRPERIRRAGLAIVPEGRRLLPDLTVEDNLRVATYSLSSSQAKAGRARALELFPELEKRLSAQARSLSGGEQQMLVLAQALVSEPRFVIIDELSLGLAPVVVQRLIPTIRGIAEAGVGVLLIEQFASARARAGKPRLRDGGRADPVLGPRAGAARELEAAALGLPAAGARKRRLLDGPASPGRRMSAGTGVSELEHVLVLSADIDRARDFYERALGLRVGDRPPLQFDGYWLYAGVRPCLHIADRASYRAHARTLGLDVPRHGRRARTGGPHRIQGRRLRRTRAPPRGARRAAGPQRRAGRWAPPAVLRRPRRDARRDQRHGSYDEGRCR